MPPVVSPYSYLPADMGSKLDDLLKNDTTTFAAATKTFDAAFQSEHLTVALCLHEGQEAEALGGSLGVHNVVDVEAHMRTIMTLHLCSVIMKASKGKGTTFANPVVVARSVFNTVLQRLELNLREDSKRAEQWRIRSNAKDGNVAKSKTGGHDANLADSMRFRLVTKCFGFQCLLNSVALDSSPLQMLLTEQKDVEKILDKFTTESTGELKEAIRSLTNSTEVEGLMSYGTLQSKRVPTCPEDEVVPAVQNPSFTNCPPGLFSRARGADLHIALAPHLSSVCLLDCEVVAKDWKATHDIVTAATKGTISNQQHLALTKSLSTSIPCTQVGLTPEVYAQIAAKNPNTAAALASHLQVPQAYTDVILNSSLELVNLNIVMTALAPSITTTNTISKYMGAVTKHLGQGTSPKEKEGIVKGFATTLNVLVGKKPDLFSAVDKAASSAVFKEFKTVPEVAALWSAVLE